MEKLKQIPAAPKRLICFLLALICMLGLLPNTAFAAGPNTIVMEDCTHNGVYYESAALSTCWLHQMKFDFNGDTVMGFCADHGGGMGWSLEGHEWNNPREITDPTVKTMMAYFYAHSRGIFIDQAKALGVDETWSSDYTWTMNAWVQAVVWRYQENLFSDPVAACAEELMYVYNNLEHTSYSSIDDVVDGTTLRDRAQYILDLGAQGVWGDCTVYEYDYFIILDDQNSSLEFLSALFFAFLFIKLVRYADSTPEQRCKIPVNIILDEMNNIGSIKDFGRRLSTIRSRMLQILMCSQSLPQLQNRYPNNLWAELLGNADTQILLGATDDVTAEYFSARSGDMTVEVNSTMTTRQSLALAQVIPQYRYTEGIGRRRVLTPDEVLRLPNDELLIIIRGQKVLRAKKFDFTEHPYAKECERTSIQQYHSEQVPTQPQEALDQSIPPKPSVTELPGQAPAASEKPPAKPKASPAKPQAPAPKTPPSGDQPSELPSKPAKRPKTLYESSRPPADF